MRAETGTGRAGQMEETDEQQEWGPEGDAGAGGCRGQRVYSQVGE